MKRLFVMSLLFVTSCVNPYAQFYQGHPDARVLPGYETIKSDLQIYTTDNFDRDGQALMRRGYIPIGNASFNAGGQLSERQLREQANRVGAHAVLIASRYTHTVSGATPLVLPQTTTSYSSGTATAYGSGGVVNAYGSGTTTTYGTQTMMIPYSIARFDVAALFFAKGRSRVGIFPAPVDDETRRRVQTNAGFKVLVVVDGSSAFQADVLPGDLVLAVAGESIQSSEHYYELLNKYEGSSVVFEIDRDGKTLEKDLEIRSYLKPARSVPMRVESQDTAPQNTDVDSQRVSKRQTKVEQQRLVTETVSALKPLTPEKKPELVRRVATLTHVKGRVISSPPAVLQAEYNDSGEGQGTSRIIYPGNHILEGEFQTLPWNQPFKDQAKARLIALDRLVVPPNSMLKGFATYSNPDGTVMECAFSVSNSSRVDRGQCFDNRGNVYRISY